MSDQNPDYVAIRRSIEKNLHRQKWMYRLLFFGMHLLFYAVSMLAVWGTVANDSQLRDTLFNNVSGASIIVILPTILWTVMIFCHIASLFTESSMGEKSLRQRLLMREAGEEILRKGLADEEMMEKPKRYAKSEHFRLSEDGVRLLIDEDEPISETDYNVSTNRSGGS